MYHSPFLRPKLIERSGRIRMSRYAGKRPIVEFIRLNFDSGASQSIQYAGLWPTGPSLSSHILP